MRGARGRRAAAAAALSLAGDLDYLGNSVGSGTRRGKNDDKIEACPTPRDGMGCDEIIR